MTTANTKAPSDRRRRGRIIFILAGIVLLVATSSLVYATINSSGDDRKTEVANEELTENRYAGFTLDVIDIIRERYWQKISEQKLAGAYLEGVKRIQGRDASLATQDKAGVAKLIEESVAEYSEEQKRRAFTEQLNHMVLMSLQPLERSKLMSRQEENKMREQVKNVDRQINLYEGLGLADGASIEDINRSFQEKSKELEDRIATAKSNNDKETVKKLESEKEELAYAKDVLTDEKTKERYDEDNTVPTVFAEELSDTVAYMKIGKMSPQTLEEFVSEAQSIKDGNHDSLILDLRGNVGGAVDILPYFLGPFIGPNQKAYDFFSQGEYTPFKTKTGWLESLVKYKKVVILTDKQMQSTAETFASALKTYNVGVLVGESTAGWGTIENTFPIETRLASDAEHFVFLVHSLTVRPDGEPIEGRGVDPHIFISNEGWQNELRKYYPHEPLVREVERLVEEG